MQNEKALARLFLRGAQRLPAAARAPLQQPRPTPHVMQRPALFGALAAAGQGLPSNRHKALWGRGLCSRDEPPPLSQEQVKKVRKQMHLKFASRIDELRSRAAVLQSKTGVLPQALAMELNEVLKFLNRAQMVVDVDEALGDDVMAAAEKYGPPQGTRSSMPNKESYAREFIMRFFGWVAERILGRTVDRDFLECFTVQMMQTYPIVRQISSSSRDAKELDLLRGFVSDDLVGILQENLDDMPAAVRAKGVEVHDVCAELTGLHFIAPHAKGKPAEGFFSFDSNVVQRRHSGADEDDDLEEGEVTDEWVQVHILFNALEKDTIWSEGMVVQRAPPVIRKSVWVYEGQLLGGNNSLHKHRNWRLVAITEP